MAEMHWLPMRTESVGDAEPAPQEAEWSKRRKGAPSNVPLPRTLAWTANLPRGVQPRLLLRSFGRIANLLAANWDEPEVTHVQFDQLLVDHRGNRRGFPPEVLRELVTLRNYHTRLHLPSDRP